MNKDINKLLLICLLAITFVIGLKVGENHVIKHQEIYKTESGFDVNFDGQIYEYTEE